MGARRVPGPLSRWPDRILQIVQIMGNGAARNLPSVSILAVDDEPRNLVALEAALASIDCTLVTARSGEEALRRVLAQDFALILLDVRMPDLDGFGTATLIRTRERSRLTPIIFLTAYDRQGALMLDGYQLGGVDYLYKPFDQAVLRAKVAIFVELFRKTAALEQTTAELTRATADLVKREQEVVALNTQLEARAVERTAALEVATRLRDKAEEALSVRDEFLSVAAHELRTPVTAIKGHAQLALRRLGQLAHNQEQTAHHLLNIDVAAGRLTVLIGDLLDVARIRNGELLLRVMPIDLVPLVNSVALRYAETEGERHHVTMDVPGEPLVVAGDAGRLEQIVDNLLNNAVKYSPGGGEIGVKLRRDARGVELTVTDSGIGLTPGAQERIFEPFGRAANARRQGVPGMGLGLHICRQIAVAHGGRMWAKSDGEGHGMTVGMHLPPTRCHAVLSG
jgi:signal transduction histidine kinase